MRRDARHAPGASNISWPATGIRTPPPIRGVAIFTAPKVWPEKLTSKWKVPIGEGYASPIFANGRILEFARQGDDEVAMSLDPENGKILWRQSYPAPYQPVNSAARHGKGPK